jgi:hypothetical protein
VGGGGASSSSKQSKSKKNKAPKAASKGAEEEDESDDEEVEPPVLSSGVSKDSKGKFVFKGVTAAIGRALAGVDPSDEPDANADDPVSEEFLALCEQLQTHVDKCMIALAPLFTSLTANNPAAKFGVAVKNQTTAKEWHDYGTELENAGGFRSRLRHVQEHIYTQLRKGQQDEEKAEQTRDIIKALRAPEDSTNPATAHINKMKPLFEDLDRYSEFALTPRQRNHFILSGFTLHDHEKLKEIGNDVKKSMNSRLNSKNKVKEGMTEMTTDELCTELREHPDNVAFVPVTPPKPKPPQPKTQHQAKPKQKSKKDTNDGPDDTSFAADAKPVKGPSWSSGKGKGSGKGLGSKGSGAGGKVSDSGGNGLRFGKGRGGGSGKGGGKGNIDASNVMCYRCHSYGHFSRDCPHPAQTQLERNLKTANAAVAKAEKMLEEQRDFEYTAAAAEAETYETYGQTYGAYADNDYRYYEDDEDWDADEDLTDKEFDMIHMKASFLLQADELSDRLGLKGAKRSAWTKRFVDNSIAEYLQENKAHVHGAAEYMDDTANMVSMNDNAAAAEDEDEFDGYGFEYMHQEEDERDESSNSAIGQRAGGAKLSKSNTGSGRC